MTEEIKIPAWIIPGAKCNYHAVKGGPLTKSNCTITSEPCNLNGTGIILVFLSELNACVSIKDITPVSKPENNH